MLGQTLSHYKIVKQIGAGGMGVVYEAEDLILKRKVAIKTLKNLSSQKARLLREARAISRINHPNIATIYDYGETEDEQPFIVMELVKGKPLDEFLKERSLNLSQAVEIIIKIADALTAAHANGIIHRDIKPSNVIVDESTVKVLDFGLSKLLEAADPSGTQSNPAALETTKTQKGMIIGTPLYLSPEQASGVEADERSDIFSLGSLLYESIAGNSPFYADSVIETCAKILRDDPPPPSKFNPIVPSSLDKITLKTLAKKPADRYQSAAELVKDLRALPDLPKEMDFTTPVIPLPSHSISQRLKSGFVDVMRIRYLPAIIFLLMVIIGSFAYYYYNSPSQPTKEAKLSYDKGEEALNDGLFLSASDYFRQAIDRDGNYVMAHARRAEALFELGYIENAREEKDRANDLVTIQKVSLSGEDQLRLEAINNTLQSDFPSAVKNYQNLARYAYEGRRAQAYLDLGKAYERNDNRDDAIESYKRSLANTSDMPSAELRLGVLYGRRQETESSLDHFSKAEQIYKIQGNPEGDIEVSYQRGILLSAMGDATKAREEAEKSLTKARVNEIPYQQIKCLLLLSRILRSSGKSVDALPYADEAITVALKKGINSLYAQSLLESGTVYLFQSKYEEAEEKYNEALRIARQYKIAVIENRALLQLGALNVRNHKADEALNYIDQVQNFFEKGGYQIDMLDLLSIKAQAITTKGDPAAAFKIYEALLSQADKVGDVIIKARAQKGVGTILAGQDDLTKALDPVYQSYSIYNSINKTTEAGYSLVLYADILAQLGRYQEADSALNLAEGLAQKNNALTPRIDLVRAEEVLSQRRFDDAIKVCQKIFSEDPQAKLPSTLEARAVLALAYAQSGQAAKALSAINQIDFGSDKIEEKEALAKLYLVKAEVMLESKHYALAANAARQAQENFKALGKPAFEWQAWLLLGRAQDQLKDTEAAKESLATSSVIFSTLSQKWNPEDFESYSARPDVKFVSDNYKIF